jgi:helicase
MKIEELSDYRIPEQYIQKFKEEKIFELYPPQADIVRKKLFQERNLVISLPTAGGKTLIASLATINKLLKSKCKIVYMVPLVALANEKYQYFKNLFDKKYKVAISVGDFDSTDPWLADYDIIVCTTEKLDSLIRHGVNWIKEVGLVIVDEIHLLQDPSRGPTLEILLTRLKEMVPRAQMFALSATIKNADEIAKWLNAVLVISDFRPVKLYEGVSFNSKIQFYERPSYDLSNLETEAAILENTLNLKKQALFFVSTRKYAESLAEKLIKITRSSLGKSESFHLETLANEIENVLEIPTKQCKRLSACIRNGVAFHHAGLLGKQRRLIENNFKSGLIRAITATPTLALGVNLPAFRVVIRDAKRYYSGLGYVYIPVLEYKQMTGRAGRPQYDQFGESILVAKSEEDAQDLVDRFVMGEPESITSKLAVEPILRMHTLALIASEFCKSEKALLEFFSKTFYAFQYGEISLIEERILNILENLVVWGLIVIKKGKLIATRLGKRVSELYIDPYTAHQFIEALKKTSKRKITSLSFLQTISNTIEMRPLLSVRSGEFSELNETIVNKENQFLQEIPDDWELEFDDFLKSVKTALMFEDWINESTEDQLLTKYRITPGELRGRLTNADWLVYSLQEIALLLGYKNILKDMRKLRICLSYGIREELITLVKLKQVGRVRARKLFGAGLKSIDALKKVPLERLSSIVGPKVASTIKEQLGERVKKIKEEKQVTLRTISQ